MTSDELERIVRKLPMMIHKRRGDMALREAARDAGLSHMTLTRLEQGEPPSLDTLIKALRWVQK